MPTQQNNDITITLLFHPAPEGGFTVTSPELPGLTTEGDTFEEAMEMAKEAVHLYLECMHAEGEAMPNIAPVLISTFKTTIPHGRSPRRFRTKTHARVAA